MISRVFIVFTLLCAAAAAAPAAAQERLPVGTHVGNSSAPSSGSGVYEGGGQRDPFVSLIVKKSTTAPPPSRPRAGLVGVALADVAVKGIMLNGSSVVAVLEGPGGKSFLAHSKDRLQDATVKAIDADGVTFTQQVADPLGVLRPRDVRKPLRQPVAEDQR